MLVLLTGGVRSGKSSLAEEMAKEAGKRVLYIATSIPFDDEMKARVARHRQQRPEDWDTHEGYTDLDQVFAAAERSGRYDAILLDCMTLLATNLLFSFLGDKADDADVKDFARAETYILEQVDRMLEAIARLNCRVILVTNEVGSGIVPENRLARHFRDIAGRVNARVAARADQVFMTVCGLKLKLK
ncbi:MAG TPA: bifunctional adenosylcobinamide kinase/adenosylcobinamide-phosphate guanylyltransferase [Clostridiales bacterium]|nr:bifunctional adenosylcobinamide kinase/adenosylcobinamide-phosphate guanylyltransferase [Clostridiales bacterium]